MSLYPSMKTLGLVCFALGLASVSFAASTPGTGISLDELKSVVAKKAVTVLDVNGSESFQEGRIPGAIDFIAQKKRIAALLPKDKNALIVAYCANENCPAYKAAVAAAKELGYTNVKHYAGGIQGWKKSGAPVEKS